MSEKFTPPEARGETEIRSPIEGEELEEHVQIIIAQLEGLKAALADPDLPDDVRKEFQEELDELQASFDEMQAGRTLYSDPIE